MFPKRSTPRTSRADAGLPDLGLRQVEPNERFGVDRRAELAERDAEREMRRRG